MRNFDRPDEPPILERNAHRWTRELLDAITEAKRTNGKVRQSLWARYNKTEVKESLKTMFSGPAGGGRTMLLLRESCGRCCSRKH